MNNFLFYCEETGINFFVQCDTELECEEILLDNGFDPDECVLIDVMDDFDAECLGYDTY